MVHQVFNDAFEALLAGWHRYMALVASTDDAEKRAELFEEVDRLRGRADRLQKARSLDEDALEERDLAAYCPFIRTTVYIPNSEIRYTRDDMLTFVCVCEREVGHRPKAWLRNAEDPATGTGELGTNLPNRSRQTELS